MKRSKTKSSLEKNGVLWLNLAGAALFSVTLASCLNVEKRSLIVASNTGGTNSTTSSSNTSGSTSATTSTTTTSTTTSSSNTGGTLVTGNTSPATTGKVDVAYSYTPTGVAAGVTFTITNGPVWASFNTSTGALTGIPLVAAAYSNISIVAHLSGQTQTIGPFTITVSGDPLLQYNWDYESTGQTAFSDNHARTYNPTGDPGSVGVDARVRVANRLGYYGNGVRVFVSDSGVDIAHEDLAANVGTGSKDYSLTSSPYLGTPTAANYNSTNYFTAETAAHGTAVSGVIAAVGWNGKGSRGIAPLATLVGSNFISYANIDYPAHWLDQVGDLDAAVYNQSWGSILDYYQTIDAGYLSAIINTVTGAAPSHRGARGATIVRSAGNEFSHAAPDAHNPDYTAPLASTTDSYNSHPFQMVVGALNALAKAATYSSPGSDIWISAPAGEFGFDISNSGPTSIYDTPATVTTDLSSCAYGGSASGWTPASTPPNMTTFQLGTNPLNSSCNYTALFNGTSSAAPHVAGAVALMLEANPNLNWRDVKHILAKTAVKIDATNGGYSIVNTGTNPNCPVIGSGGEVYFDHCDPVGHLNMPGWFNNGAGYHFHYWYGFGALDASAAVGLARTYTAGALGPFMQSNWASDSHGTANDLNLSIPDFDKNGVTSTLTVSQSYTIEAVQIAVFITHGYIGDIGVELVSPAGTRSVVMHTNNGMGDHVNLGNVTPTVLNNADPTVGGAVMVTNAFYGENSQGTWTINVIDGHGFDSGYSQTFTGKLNRWAINISGHTPLATEP